MYNNNRKNRTSEQIEEECKHWWTIN